VIRYKTHRDSVTGGRSPRQLRLVGALGVVLWTASVGIVVPRAAAPQAPAPAPKAVAAPAAPATPQASTTQPAPVVATMVTQYCAGCHNDRTKSGGLSLTGLDPSNAPADAEVWEKVIRKVRTGMMPPSGVKHPDPATRSTFVTTLASTLDRAAAGKPNPGRPALYRLNRTEYANAFRDLLEL
jgi:mono/diheme cytochrome c family protein